MKKILALVLAAVSAFSLCCCGNGEKETPAEDNVKPVIYGIKGPTAVGLVNMMDKKSGKYDFTLVGSPDEIVGKLTTGDADIAAIPTNLAATLYKKTDGGVQMLACNTLGVLSVIENGNTVKTVADLKGKTVLSSGQGSNPEYILDYLLTENGIDPEKDVTIKFVDDNDALTAQLLASEPGTLAMVPQPAATAALVKASQQNIKLTKVLDINSEWDKTAAKNSLIMGCMAVRKAFADEHPDAVSAFLKDYEASIAAVDGDLKKTAELCERYEVLPSAAIAEKAVPECNVVFIAGDDMRPAIEPYFNILFKANPASIGGAVPDEGFYYTN